MSAKKVKKAASFPLFPHLILFIAALTCVIPFALLFISSFTSENLILQNGYTFFPSAFSLEAYEYLWIKAPLFVRAYGITVFVTVVGTTASLIITSMLAYGLTRKEVPGYKVMNFLVVLTILFNGGLVPTYIIYTQIFRVKNTIFGLLLPGLLLNGFNVLLMRSYFSANIPPALLESAKIDGAGEFRIFLNIVMPLSRPIVVTIALMSGIAYWNNWFNGLIYITNPKLFSIQALLNQILMSIEFLATSDIGGRTPGNVLPSMSVRMAIAVIGVIPILIVYPFLQKHFVKGITLGAVKG
jgi:putative aldouronate transport system permease protein